MENLIKEINTIFCNVFNDPDLIINRNTSSEDIDSWDSLNNMHIVVAVEKKFSVRIELRDIQSWNNVGDLCDWLENHL